MPSVKWCSNTPCLKTFSYMLPGSFFFFRVVTVLEIRFCTCMLWKTCGLRQGCTYPIRHGDWVFLFAVVPKHLWILSMECASCDPPPLLNFWRDCWIFGQIGVPLVLGLHRATKGLTVQQVCIHPVWKDGSVFHTKTYVMWKMGSV